MKNLCRLILLFFICLISNMSIAEEPYSRNNEFMENNLIPVALDSLQISDEGIFINVDGD